MQMLAPKCLAGKLSPLHVQCSEISVAPTLFCSDLVLGRGAGGVVALFVSDAVLIPALFQSIYVGGENSLTCPTLLSLFRFGPVFP